MRRPRIRFLDRSNHHFPRCGISFVEILVVMVIVAVLVSLALPAIGRARQAARKTQCLNNLRNITFGVTQFDHFNGRLPASGNYLHDAQLRSKRHVSWAVTILPYLDQNSLYDLLDLDKPLNDPANNELKTAYVPAYVCPMDISRSKKHIRDLSYVVNAGVGFTIRTRDDVRDCPANTDWQMLDLNGDGSACTGDDEVDDLDRKLFRSMGLFFLETWNTKITKRHHSIGDIKDGTSQTFMVTENVRAGFDPGDDTTGFFDGTPYRSSFFIGNPCPGSSCTSVNVDYQRCNAGRFRINSGLNMAEGTSPVPNSFHEGGVNMAYADGHVEFLSEQIDGAVYASLTSPVGLLLDGTPLQQVIVGSGD